MVVTLKTGCIGRHKNVGDVQLITRRKTNSNLDLSNTNPLQGQLDSLPMQEWHRLAGARQQHLTGLTQGPRYMSLDDTSSGSRRRQGLAFRGSWTRDQSHRGLQDRSLHGSSARNAELSTKLESRPQGATIARTREEGRHYKM